MKPLTWPINANKHSTKNKTASQLKLLEGSQQNVITATKKNFTTFTRQLYKIIKFRKNSLTGINSPEIHLYFFLKILLGWIWFLHLYTLTLSTIIALKENICKKTKEPIPSILTSVKHIHK